MDHQRNSLALIFLLGFSQLQGSLAAEKGGEEHEIGYFFSPGHSWGWLCSYTECRCSTKVASWPPCGHPFPAPDCELETVTGP